MVLSYLRAHVVDGAAVEANDGRYHLRWPDGTEHEDAVFSRQEADAAGGTLVTVEDKRVRRLLANLPHVAPQMAIPSIVVDGVSDKVSGWWSLWRIALQSEDERELRLSPLFVDDGDRVLAPTARTVWDSLIDGRFQCASAVPPSETAIADKLRLVASERGEQLFRELATRHQQRLERERKKTGEAFRIRRKALRHVGLDAVRQYRERQLDQEEFQWNERISRREQTLPELGLVSVVRIAKA